MEDLTARDRATIERAKRLLAARLATAGVDLASPRDLESFLLAHLDGQPDEHSIVLALDDARRLLGWRVWPGSLRSCEMQPRQIAALALGVNAAQIIIGHSHPAAICCPAPSEQDLEATHRMRTILGWLDLRLLDSFLVSGGVVQSIGMSAAADIAAQADLLQGALHERLADIAECLDAALPPLRTGRCPTHARILIEHAARVASGT